MMLSWLRVFDMIVGKVEEGMPTLYLYMRSSESEAK